MGLTRGEFFARIGLVEEVDPLVTDAYWFCEQIEAGRQDRGAGHVDPWHVSFHGSEFPGDNSVACGRRAIYRLMDMPRGYFTRKSRQLMDQGKDMETQIVKRLWRAGYLLSNPPHGPQTQFEDPEHMLTTTTDAIVLKPRMNKPFVVELKQIYAEHVDEMRRLVREIHPAYVRQVKCEIGMAHEAGPQRALRCFNSDRLAIELQLWEVETDPHDHSKAVKKQHLVCPQHLHTECLREVEIEPPDYGYLYYVSRNNPLDKIEYYFEYDPKFMEEGRRKLAQWRDAFINDKLPATRFEDKRFSHPFGWTWTMSQKMPNSPCHWCEFGEVCRIDHKEAVKRGNNIRLSESAAIEEAREIRPDYDYEAVRRAVLARWGFSEPEQAKAA